MSEHSWDLLIRNAKLFDGSGQPPVIQDLAVRDGRVAARGADLPTSAATEVIDAAGRWLLPGMLDIHTHLDLEVEVAPTLPEVVRHGTTTVLIGNCSLGTTFGSQMTDDQEPIVDCFTRVENIPKAVLRKCSEKITWDNSGDYLNHFDELPLGPNIGALVPHSMLRVEAMGLKESISRAPTEAELEKMEALLEQAMEQGYVGMSTDGLPFHYLSNDPNTDKRIPTQFASFGELKRLLRVVRGHERVWQTTPILENRLMALWYFTLTSGRLWGGKPLKTSALSAMEMAVAPKASKVFLGIAGLMNTPLFKGNIHFQALGTNFRIWSDGIVSPLYEELESTCRLIACEYDDVEGRRALMNDPAWVKQFREDWLFERTDDFASKKARLLMPSNLVIRDPELMVFDGAPIAEWNGETFQQVIERLQGYQGGDAGQARSDAEREAFDTFPNPLRDDADFMLQLMRNYDKGFRFYTDVGNVGNRATLGLLLHKNSLPGFNDSGAHITNMAFFDGNLMSLKLAREQGEDTVATMVKRLTREPAEFFGLDVGTLEIGAQADMVLINPDAFDGWHTDDTRQLVYRDIFEHDQMVNRPPPIVERVMINGETVWNDGDFTPDYGNKRYGRLLRAA